MPGLPHYRNSRSAMNLYEPLYMNLYEVIITLPPALRAKYPENWIWTEQVFSITGLKTDIVNEAGAEQYYAFAKRRFAKSKPADTVLDLEVTFEVNVDAAGVIYPVNVFRDWGRLIYHPLTGRMSLKADYVGSMIVSQANKAGQVLQRWTMPTVWINGPLEDPYDLENLKEDVYRLKVKFAADWWRFDEISNGLLQ